MKVFVALGSNIEQPLVQLTQACDALRNHPKLSFIRCSPWYASKAIGPEQPDYINGVVEIDTELSGEHLLDVLQSIENHQGRERTLHWGPRTLDLDILLYGQQNIHTARLTVPHPQMPYRNFVLRPLLDIAPQQTLPNGTSIASLLAKVGSRDLKQLANTEASANTKRSPD